MTCHDEYRRGHEVGSKRAGWRYPSTQWVKNAKRLVELDEKFPSILSGKAEPADAAESLALAKSCYDKKLYASSLSLWKQGLEAQPFLADDVNVQNRYNAACAATLAGSGQGKDDPPLDDADRARSRTQAITWLKADLAAWSTVLQQGQPKTHQAVSKTLQHWKADPDLAGIRDDAALAKLPLDEQEALPGPLGRRRRALGKGQRRLGAMT
jgi:hypothetical protein